MWNVYSTYMRTRALTILVSYSANKFPFVRVSSCAPIATLRVFKVSSPHSSWEGIGPFNLRQSLLTISLCAYCTVTSPLFSFSSLPTFSLPLKSNFDAAYFVDHNVYLLSKYRSNRRRGVYRTSSSPPPLPLIIVSSQLSVSFPCFLPFLRTGPILAKR